MGKEILFRGKTPFTGTIGSDKWIESKSIRMQGNYVYLFFENKWMNVNIDTLGQYTGLKDKNGTKIFEGDIVVLKGKYGDWLPKKVIYGNDYGVCAYTLASTDYILNGSFINLDNVRVIGNIHDNPELLKEK